MKSILTSQEAARADAATLALLGPAVDRLLALGRADFPQPDWFVILPDTFEACLSPWQLQALHRAAHAPAGADPAATQALVARAALPPALAAEIVDAARALPLAGAGGDALLRVRSALTADTAENAIVGKLEEIPMLALAIWQAAFAQAPSAPVAPVVVPPVLVQRLAGAVQHGHATSADPVTGRRHFAVVEIDAANDAGLQRFLLDRADRIVSRPQDAAAFGKEIPADSQLQTAAGLARRAAALLGQPQRIEWAADRAGRLWLLDCQPLAAFRDLADPDAPVEDWVRSPLDGWLGLDGDGPLRPLTISLAQKFSIDAVRALLRAFDVSADVVTGLEREGCFRRLVGQARGRLCWHLPSLRRLLDALPDDGLARRCFEMVFTAAGSPPSAAGGDGPLSPRQAFVFLSGLHRRLRRLEKRFARVLDATLAAHEKTPLAECRPEELLGAWRALIDPVLTYGGEAPALNAYLAFVSDGLLRAWSAAWCGDAALPNALLAAGSTTARAGTVRPAEPAQRLREMAELLQHDEAAIARFADEADALTAGALDAALAERPRLGVQFGDFLEQYHASAAPGHFLLEADDLRANPRPLVRALGHYARGFRRAPYEPPTRGPDDAVRQAEEKVAVALHGQRWRGVAFRWLQRHARARLLDRERHAQTLTRLVLRARAIFTELGRRWRELAVLAAPDDVHFLTLAELSGFLEGTAPSADLRAPVAARRAEAAENGRLAPPGEHFQTRGAFFQGNTFAAIPRSAANPTAHEVEEEDARNEATTAAASVRGTPIFPGNVRARVRRVRDPRSATLLQGEILVAERADAGWILLLAAAGGLVLANGSTTSRVAFLARELGIPTVFNVSPEFFAALRDGTLLDLDGAAGTVRVLTEAA
ncbi:MAG: hypothetical protein JO295_01430 [Verrucomicrobia bacterium]|nr:hypothetical protein [Verrucomicrobiota bacterium]